MELKFKFERETKNTRRYEEERGDNREFVVGTLYLQKSATAKLGNPDSLKVTIEAEKAV